MRAKILPNGIHRTCATATGCWKADHGLNSLWTQDWETLQSHDLVRSGSQHALHRYREGKSPLGAQCAEDAAGNANYRRQGLPRNSPVPHGPERARTRHGGHPEEILDVSPDPRVWAATRSHRGHARQYGIVRGHSGWLGSCAGCTPSTEINQADMADNRKYPRTNG